MKKCNFFAVLVTALFMFMGVAGNSQELMTSQKAFVVVESQVNTLSKTSTAPSSQQAAPAASAVQRMKIAVGNAMLEPLKAGNGVREALTNAIAPFRSNDSKRQAIVNEVETYYLNLLKKVF